MPIPRTLTYIRTALVTLVFLCILAVADTTIYLGIAAAWPFGIAMPHLLVRLVLISLSIFTIAIVATSSYRNTAFTRILYLIASVWMGVFVYLFFGSFAYGVMLGIASMAGIQDTFPWLGQTIGITVAVTVMYGLINAWPIRTSRVVLDLPNLPAFWKGKRAVFLSDIHLGAIHTERFARRVASAVNAHKPDIVFIGGDLYDGVKVDERVVVAPFATIKPPHGVYFVTGNHEEFTDSSRFLSAIRSVGIRPLNNEVADVEGLQIVGVTDHDSIHKGRLAEILASMPIDRSRASIFLKHQPSHLEIAEAAGLSFQISGHTHRAQMFPLNLVPHWIYKGYSYGLKKHGSMHVYTSSGVGSWGPPIRVGSDSEIVVIEFV